MNDLLSLFDQRFEAASSCGPAGQGWSPWPSSGDT